MKRKAVELAIESDDYHAAKDAIAFFFWVVLSLVCGFFRDLADTATLELLANLATVLTFFGALIRTVYIWTDWRARRKMIAIKKKLREEEARKVEKERARSERIEKNMKDILYAPTSDEIAEILERNSREK